jgi:glycosyltransferase involved in cell wall biosynthesis
MNPPTVSIITSTYNRSDLLRKAIKSVIAQDYANWEVCIVGDCTPDDTEVVVGFFGD